MILQPHSRARRRSRSHRSSRAGAALCSMATPRRPACLKISRKIKRKRFAAKDLPPGGMAEYADIGVFDGAQHAGRHLFAALIEARVHAGDHDVQLRQHFVVKVERAVAQDIDLDPGEYADFSFHFAIHLANPAGMFESALLVKAVGNDQRSWSDR